ncbi:MULTISPECIES: PilN domain-containing protein [unclassified Methylobacterium]|uniref:PilN domain-containing protein n=1 Tax=unclassified Methylobacterium TaxID=2615210 RepID=UPI0006F797C9|nr:MULTISPECIES: PilN domain-containing protein [unclassified Methylobacterium]KQP94626.1 hypothetical protein ASF57_21615 [Methylobacterium sp. Leaf117]MCK2056371.1 PilN domain-containing protein [Methylobacterium sp. 37f]
MTFSKGTMPAPLHRAANIVQAIGAALLDALVATIRPLLGRFSTGLSHVVTIAPNGLVLHTSQKDRLGPPQHLDSNVRAPETFHKGAVELRLPPEVFLTRALRLPDAGRSYLQPIITHRLERLTPWRADQVLYAYSVVDGVSEDGTIGVDLLATSVDLVAPFLARLANAGLTATALGSAAEPLDAPLRFDLYKGRTQPADDRLRGRIGRGLAILLSGLTVACLLSAVVAASAASNAEEVRQRLTALRTKLTLRGGVGTSRERILIEGKRTENATIVLIDKLSRALPDGTVLRELDIGPARIRLVGRSIDAPALIARLEAEAGLKNPRFAAPVIRDAEKRDAFDLVATRGDVMDVGQ